MTIPLAVSAEGNARCSTCSRPWGSLLEVIDGDVFVDGARILLQPMHTRVLAVLLKGPARSRAIFAEAWGREWASLNDSVLLRITLHDLHDTLRPHGFGVVNFNRARGAHRGLYAIAPIVAPQGET